MIDFDILKEHGTTNERLREVLSSKLHPPRYPKEVDADGPGSTVYCASVLPTGTR